MTPRIPGRRLDLAQISAIAVNTFREAVRSRVFYILMAFAVSMILFSVVMGFLTVGSRSKIIMDLGLASTSFFCVMTAIFVGIGLVYQEVEKKTIYNILSKPLHRSHFLLGRYVGLMGVLLVNLFAMTTLLALMLLLFKGFTLKVYMAAGFIFLELAILTAVALFFSSVASPVVSAICTGAFFVVGRTSSSLADILVPQLQNAFAKKAAMGLYHVLPDLGILNVSNLVSYDVPIAPGFTARAILYSAAYVAILLTAACLAFRKRDLV